MMDISKKYEEFCLQRNIPFTYNTNVSPYDETTLFCPAGMQQFKQKFKDTSYTGTVANIQTCIRLNDLEEIGDGTHLLQFNMIGLFSFRELEIEHAIKFWFDFLTVIGVRPDHITVHPDKIQEWLPYFLPYENVIIVQDNECVWSDGDIGGYCTEFYVDGVEIGNIVNPLGNCIDVGFGLERLEMIVNGSRSHDKNKILKDTILSIIESGYKPSNVKQGYVLRKLLRQLYKSGGKLKHQFFDDEIKRQEKILNRYNNLKEKHKDKSKDWWYETHGINLDEIDE